MIDWSNFWTAWSAGAIAFVLARCIQAIVRHRQRQQLQQLRIAVVDGQVFVPQESLPKRDFETDPLPAGSWISTDEEKPVTESANAKDGVLSFIGTGQTMVLPNVTATAVQLGMCIYCGEFHDHRLCCPAYNGQRLLAERQQAMLMASLKSL